MNTILKQHLAIVSSGIAIGGGFAKAGYEMGQMTTNDRAEAAQIASECQRLIGSQALAAADLRPDCRGLVDEVPPTVPFTGFTAVAAADSDRLYTAADFQQVAEAKRGQTGFEPGDLGRAGMIVGLGLWGAFWRLRLRSVGEPNSAQSQ